MNVYKLKGKEIEVGKTYEFMGEIEVDPNTGHVFLSARVIKTGNGFHKTVYKETTELVNGLIESITSRNQQYKKKAAEEIEKKIVADTAKMQE